MCGPRRWRPTDLSAPSSISTGPARAYIIGAAVPLFITIDLCMPMVVRRRSGFENRTLITVSPVLSGPLAHPFPSAPGWPVSSSACSSSRHRANSSTTCAMSLPEDPGAVAGVLPFPAHRRHHGPRHQRSELCAHVRRARRDEHRQHDPPAVYARRNDLPEPKTHGDRPDSPAVHLAGGLFLHDVHAPAVEARAGTVFDRQRARRKTSPARASSKPTASKTAKSATSATNPANTCAQASTHPHHGARVA